MHAVIDQLEQATDPDEIARLHDRFGSLVYDATGNETLSSILRALQMRGENVRRAWLSAEPARRDIALDASTDVARRPRAGRQRHGQVDLRRADRATPSLDRTAPHRCAGGAGDGRPAAGPGGRDRRTTRSTDGLRRERTDTRAAPAARSVHGRARLPERVAVLPRVDGAAARGRCGRSSRSSSRSPGRQGCGICSSPTSEHGAGLTNLEYAPLCEVMGRSHLAPEVFNCAAPDTGNMEVLARYGTPEQQERWLSPLLAGEIRSAFAMTEPAVASSDATNIESSIVRDGDEYVDQRPQVVHDERHRSALRDHHLHGQVRSGQPDRHRQQSMILVPKDTPGVEVIRPLPVFNFYGMPDRASEVAVHRRAGPGRQHAARRGARVRDRPGPARPRPHPPLHAADRAGRTCARDDVPTHAAPGGVRSTRSPSRA